MADYKTITYPVSPLEKGQQTKADSVSVTIASDQDPIPITGSISASNPSVSTTGSAVPAQATFVGGKDGSGNLIAVAVDSNGIVSENVKTIEGVDDTGNSSSTPLGSNAVFTGTWINITNYTAISLGIYADQNSATDGLVAEYSYDGVTVHHEHKYSYTTAGIGIGYNLTAEFKYYRIKYTNGSVAQTDFKLQSILKATTLSPSMYKITNTLTDNSQAIVTRSVITGVTTGGGGGYVNVKVNPSGSLVADVTGTVASTQSGTWNINNVSGTVSLPTGAATDSTISTMSGKLPATLGQTTSANSMAVVIASDQNTIKTAQTNSKGEFVRNDYTSTSVTTSAYVQLIASTASSYSAIEIFDSSGQTLMLAIGGAGSEVDQFIIFPGGNGRIPFTIASGSRISIRALSATANSGEIDINLYV